MPRLLISVLLIASHLFCISVLSAQQPTFSSASCPCTLRGTVLDSVTGNPIHGAFVQASADSARSAFTDAEGKFQFDALPAGPLTLTAAKPGFLSNEELGPSSPKSFSLQLAPDAAPAVLKLTPEGVLVGDLTEENGEPLEGFFVSLIYRNPVNLPLSQDPRQRVFTDDEGRFRIAGLHPGSYYVAVRPIEGSELASSRSAAAPQGFASVLYPAATDVDSAIPIKVRPGQSSQVNDSLKRSPFVQLSGSVSGYGSEQHVVLNLQDSLGEQLPQKITFDTSTGTFHTKWIPPGVYTLFAQTYAQDSFDASRPSFFASRVVTANSNLSAIHLALQPTVNIPVVFRGFPTDNLDKEPAPDLMLLLIPKGQRFRGRPHNATAVDHASDDLSASPAFVVAGVEPGTYEVTAMVYRRSAYYLESVTWGSTDLLREPLILSSSGAVPPIDVVVRQGAATLNGTVVSGDQPSSAIVVLLPPDERKLPQFANVSPNGEFGFANLAPGTYRVIALDDLGSLDLKNQDGLRSISSKAHEVTLAPSQTASIRLELTTVGE